MKTTQLAAKRYNGKCLCGFKASVFAKRTANIRVAPNDWRWGFRADDGRELHGCAINTASIEFVCLCGRTITLKPVVGKHNDSIVCDARCENAIGHKCECACGGKNHGASHA